MSFDELKQHAKEEGYKTIYYGKHRNIIQTPEGSFLRELIHDVQPYGSTPNDPTQSDRHSANTTLPQGDQMDVAPNFDQETVFGDDGM